jgi:arsenate reductase
VRVANAGAMAQGREVSATLPSVKVSMTYNPSCGTARNVLAILREKGIEPEIIEYLKTPLQAEEIMALVRKMKVPLRAVVRTKEKIYSDLKLEKADDDTLLAAMVLHPILLNRPIVTTPKGTKLCRPSETVAEIL